MKPVTIGKLSKASGVSIETIRYYEREGLLSPPIRTVSNYRLYTEQAHRQLAFINEAKTLGFSLKEIRQLLKLQDGGPKAQVREIAAHHLQDVRQKLAALSAIERVLDQVVGECDGCGDTSAGCPILDSLTDATKSQSNAS